MATRREAIFGGLALASVSAGRPALAEQPLWEIPTNEEIRRLLADRIDVQRRAVGMVVGVIEPAGRRVVAYGEARNGRALDGDTVFQIGSVSKVFASLVLADAVVRGEARLEDGLATYLPRGVTMSAMGRPITLLDLATHMSGLPSMPTNFDLSASPNPVQAYSVEDLHRFLAGWAPVRAPGAAFGYSNLGVSLLGRLLAERQGADYEALLASRILRPLGLTSTSIRLNGSQRRRLTPGHDMYLQPVDSWEMRTLKASGSMRSTANDLLTFLEAHVSGSGPLARAMEFQVSQPPPANSPLQSLGLPLRGTTWFHDGGKEGYRSFVAFNRQARTGVAVLSNTRSDDRLDPLVLHLMTGRPLAAPVPAPKPPHRSPAIRLDRRVMALYAGRYRSGAAAFSVAGKGARLLLDELGAGVSELYAEGDGRFLARTSNTWLQFTGSPGAPADAFVLSEGGQERTARRA